MSARTKTTPKIMDESLSRFLKDLDRALIRSQEEERRVGSEVEDLLRSHFALSGEVNIARVTGAAQNEYNRLAQTGFHPFDQSGSNWVPVDLDLGLCWFADRPIQEPLRSLRGMAPPHGPILYIAENENHGVQDETRPGLRYLPRFFIGYPDSPLRKPMEEIGAEFLHIETVFGAPDADA